MKTKTLSILFALVMVLSLSAGVFAQDFTETWDEETVLTVFSDLDILFPDLFADEDSNYLFTDQDDALAVIPVDFPTDEDGEVIAEGLALDEEDYEAKAPTDESNYDFEASYDPCGDGLIKFDLTIKRVDKDSFSGYYGPDKITYIRRFENVTVDGADAEIKKCTSSGGDNCRSVKFNNKGEAHITGYIAVPTVLDGSSDPTVEFDLITSTYMTALWDVTPTYTTSVSGTAVNSGTDYCQESLEEYMLGGLDSVRARYDENTGEARFQATIRNYQPSSTPNYAIPAEIYVQQKDNEGNDVLERYTNYTCKYTVYNTYNAAPRTDYCKFGEGIALAPNSVIRFDITIDHLKYVNSGDLPFTFRVGGMTKLVGNDGTTAGAGGVDSIDDTNAYFIPVPYPCPVVTRMSVMDPIRPFMTFYAVDQENDKPIEPSGAYGVYEGGLWGLYQKCGRYAYMAVRLQNDGIQNEIVYLDHVAVAVNGGTPMSWQWVLTTVPEVDDGEIELAPGEDVILIGKALVTNVPSQMNSDLAITGAVNFLDYGFYVTGKVYSDHNNTNCTVAP